jgi:hypothetical protein
VLSLYPSISTWISGYAIKIPATFAKRSRAGNKKGSHNGSILDAVLTERSPVLAFSLSSSCCIVVQAFVFFFVVIFAFGSA